jgi:hypothetical protein
MTHRHRHRRHWIVSSLTGLCLAAGAGLALAAASEEAAAGTRTEVRSTDAAEPADGAAPERHSEIRLVLDHDGNSEQLELVDLHELAVGESRNLTTESGTPFVVTRDEEGFEIDLDGRKIRVLDGLPGGEAGGPGQFHNRIVVRDAGDGGDGEASETNVMILRSHSAGSAGENGAGAGGEAAGREVVMMRRSPGDEGHAFAYSTGGGELPRLAEMALPIEATIHRLEASPKFQELDEATRAKVLEALRESAPKAGTFVAGVPGARTIVLEMKDETKADAAN